jgi:hypothetical protein
LILSHLRPFATSETPLAFILTGAA